MKASRVREQVEVVEQEESTKETRKEANACHRAHIHDRIVLGPGMSRQQRGRHISREIKQNITIAVRRTPENTHSIIIEYSHTSIKSGRV
jgi:hypothetical protein